MEADVFVPAAIENVITEETARHLPVKVVLEAANHPTTPEGDLVLQERGNTGVARPAGKRRRGYRFVL